MDRLSGLTPHDVARRDSVSHESSQLESMSQIEDG